MPAVIFVADKIEAKIRGQKFEEKQILASSQRIALKIFINYKGKNNLIVEKPGRHHFNEVIKVNIASNKITPPCTP